MIPCDRIEKITVCPFLRLKSLWNGNSEIAHSLILADVAQLPVLPQLELTHRLKRNGARQNVGMRLLGHGVNGR